MKIGILETGRTPAAMIDTFGSYADMLTVILGKADPSLSFEVVAVMDNAPLPAPDSCDGWLITGSRSGVYEGLEWMAPLEEFLRQTMAAGIPIVGICFGHQILAKAMGARVEKSDRGWGVGPHRYDMTEKAPWMEGFKDRIVINAIHQDQVLEVPDGARVIASSEFCPIAALAYGDQAITFQPHPEFSVAYEQALLRELGGKTIPQDRSEPALALLADPATAANDADTLAKWISAFFRQSRGKG